MPKNRTYLDTGVLIAAFRGQHSLHEAAFAILDDPNREFVISDFLKLELLPKAIFHDQQEEAEFYRMFFDEAAEVLELTPEHSREVLVLACKYGLAACDAIHVHTALTTSATEFVTTENQKSPFSA